MANANNPGSAGLRPRGKARCLPPQGPSEAPQHASTPPQNPSALPRQSRSRRSPSAPEGSLGDGPWGGGHLALPRGRKPAQWDGANAGVAPSSANHRTRLPHVEAGEVPQHVCFRLADSLPPKLRREPRDKVHRKVGVGELVASRRKIDSALDAGYGACWLRRQDVAEVVQHGIQHFDQERYLLHEWVVMPNHAHVLFTPLRSTPLSSIVHSWKAYTAKRANVLLGRRGAFWDSDYFDRTIRNDRHFRVTADYIRANPVNAGLCDAPEDWRWSSAYEPSVRDAGPVWLVSRAPRPPRAIPRPRQRTMRFLHAS